VCERHAPVFRLELSPRLTTPNEEHGVEGDAFVHVTPDNALHFSRVGARKQDMGPACH
jgi:hypothetical protein